MNYRTDLIALAEAYAAARGLSVARVATLARNDGKFFRRLQEGAGCTVETYQGLLQWFSDRWEEAGAGAWPASVARPEPAAADQAGREASAA